MIRVRCRELIDLVLKNCRIFGAGDSGDTIGIKDGRIVHIGYGDVQEAKRQIDLEGRTLLPGFIDAHTHLQNLGLSLVRLDLSDTKSREEALEKTARYASGSKSAAVVGYGWDETQWGESDYISRKEMDSIGKPVVLFRKDMHMAVLNTKALTSLKIDSVDGAVKEEKMDLIRPLTNPDQEELKRALDAAVERAVSLGITTVRDIMGQKVRQLLHSARNPIRIFQLIYGNEYGGEALNSEFSWGVKMFLDGSVGSRTAAHEGWEASNLKYGTGDLKTKLQGLWTRGIPVAMHAIGEIAVDQAIGALEDQKGTLRNSIEHFELVNLEMLERIGKSTVVSSQPNFLQWSQKGGLYEEALGSKWVGKDNPFRRILDSGIRLAFGSDCMPMGPNYGISLAVNSEHSYQKISMEEAIGAYTSGGAYVLHEEAISGKIALGYRADLVVFDEHYLEDTAGVGLKKPVLTMANGKVVYSDGTLA